MSLTTDISVVSILRQCNLVRAFCFVQYFIRLPTCYAGQSAFELLVDKATKLGPGSSVGIATDYGLDGPGSNPGGDEIFRPSKPSLGPTQPPVQWVQCLSRG